MKSKGTVNLPLHGGKAPRWLFKRMVKLSKAITEIIIEDYSRKEFINRITDPYWFQALSCTIGFDWHSSGTTTTTCGALKVALDPEEHGIAFTGGKGKASRKTPDEIRDLEGIFALEPNKFEDMAYTSKISAKVDNTCVQDNYQLYHHSFIVTEKGDWGVIQQGMFDKENYARRYHWMSESVEEFVNEPHRGVCCDKRETQVLNMTANQSEETRNISVDLVRDNPEHLKRYFKDRCQTSISDFQGDNIKMPSHHPVLDMDISERGWKILKKAYEIQPSDYEELISLHGMGAKKIRALALVSDLIYGSKASWEDPVRYSFAHGGKDGTPYPVDRDIYDSTISHLKETLEKCEIENKEKKNALERLGKLISKEGDI